MAIVGGQQDDEELNGKPPAMSGSGGFVGGSGGKGATTSVGSPAATSSGSYTNLSNYLQANQGAGTTTGQAAAGIVDQSAGAAKDAIGGYQGAANKEISDGSKNIGVDQSVVKRIKDGMGTDADVKGVHYDGPNDIAHLSGPTTGLQTAAQGAVDTAGGNAMAAGSGQGGVAGLLTQAYKQPNYTRGENNLDSFLVGGSGGQAALNSSADAARGVAGSYGKVNEALGGSMKDASATADATKQVYGEEIAKTPKYAPAPAVVPIRQAGITVDNGEMPGVAVPPAAVTGTINAPTPVAQTAAGIAKTGATNPVQATKDAVVFAKRNPLNPVNAAKATVGQVTPQKVVAANKPAPLQHLTVGANFNAQTAGDVMNGGGPINDTTDAALNKILPAPVATVKDRLPSFSSIAKHLRFN